MVDRLAPSTRHKFCYQGRTVYEWDQTLEEVNLYVEVPPGVGAKLLDVDISIKHLCVGIKGNPPYLDQDLWSSCKAGESLWTIEDGVLTVQLVKAVKGEAWQAALQGHQVDAATEREERKRLMLERFQQENPGFDFSNAEFNGDVPNPATFLGGIRESGR